MDIASLSSALQSRPAHPHPRKRCSTATPRGATGRRGEVGLACTYPPLKVRHSRTVQRKLQRTAGATLSSRFEPPHPELQSPLRYRMYRILGCIALHHSSSGQVLYIVGNRCRELVHPAPTRFKSSPIIQAAAAAFSCQIYRAIIPPHRHTRTRHGGLL
jgi:hypothetical protein